MAQRLLFALAFLAAACTMPTAAQGHRAAAAMQDPLAGLFGALTGMGGGGGNAGEEGEGAHSFSLIESLLQLVTGQPIYGKNCGPSIASDSYIDDLDECCYVHDKCHAQPAAQAAYRYCQMGNPGLDAFLGNFGVACDCDAALLRCIQQVRGRCDALPAEQRAACRAGNAYKLSKAVDVEVAFKFLDSCAQCPARA